MSSPIIKDMAVTRVRYSIARVVDGVPTFFEQPMAVFKGLLPAEKVNKMLAKQLGKDAVFMVSNIDAAKHRFVMPFEEFVRLATIDDGTDTESDTAANDDSESDFVAETNPVEETQSEHNAEESLPERTFDFETEVLSQD